MTLNEYQSKAYKFRKWQTPQEGFDYLDRALPGEVGELLGPISKALKNGTNLNARTFVRGELSLELGDILWCVAVYADMLGYDLNEIAAMNLAKLEGREKK